MDIDDFMEELEVGSKQQSSQFEEPEARRFAPGRLNSGAAAPASQPSDDPDRAKPWEIGGVYIGKGPEDFGSALALNEDYLQMVRNARLLADQTMPPREEAMRVYKTLCRHWLEYVNGKLSKDRYATIAIAEAVFGFSVDEDPQMSRLEATYNFHCGIIALVYEVCVRAKIVLPDTTPAGDTLDPFGSGVPKTGRGRRRISNSTVEPNSLAGQRRQRPDEDGDRADDTAAETPLWKKRKLEVTVHFHKIIELVYHLHELLHATFRTFLAASPEEPAMRPVNEFDLMRFSHLQISGLNHFQNLCVALSRHFFHKRYRRSGDHICAELLLPSSRRGNFVHSHYWKPLRLIRDEIIKFCDKDTHGTAWANCTRASGHFENVIQYFVDGRDKDLPPVDRNRRLFSFQNGLLILGLDLPGYVGPELRADGYGRFFAYDGSGGFSSDLVPLSVHSSRFFKSNFPEDCIEMLNSGDSMKPNILCWTPTGPRGSAPFLPTAWPTPLFDGLLNRQGYDFFTTKTFDPAARHCTPDVSSLFQLYAMFGRLLYRVNELDNFQLCVFLLGIAGTGKSVICEIISKFYGKEAVGKMSANCQQTFALSGFVGKHLIICPEVKSNFGLAASDFQSMVTGESISANVKHKEIVTIPKWQAGLLMAGNDVPPWSDSLGALFRRLLVVRLTNPVSDREVDTELSRRLAAELPLLLVKFHSCYLYMLELCKNSSFWLFADEKFLSARTSMELELSPTKKFLSTSDQLERDSCAARSAEDFTMYIPYTSLMELCTEWCKKQGIPLSRMTSSNREDHNRKLLADSNFRVSIMMLPFTPGCAERQTDYVLGVTDHNAPLRLPPNWRTTVVAAL